MVAKMRDISDPRQNIFDLIDLQLDLYITNSEKRGITRERLLFYLSLLNPTILDDFGYLFNRIQIFQFLHNLNNAMSWTHDDWDEHINTLRKIKVDLCRNDARELMIPSKVMGLDSTENCDEDFKKSQSTLKDGGENTMRCTMINDDFQNAEFQMQLQKGCSIVRDGLESETILESLVRLDSLINFVQKLKFPNGSVKPYFIAAIEKFKKMITKHSEYEQNNSFVHLWKQFEDEHHCSFDGDFKVMIEKLMLKCHVEMLPTPILVQLQYNSGNTEKKESITVSDNSNTATKHILKQEKVSTTVEELRSSRSNKDDPLPEACKIAEEAITSTQSTPNENDESVATMEKDTQFLRNKRKKTPEKFDDSDSEVILTDLTDQEVKDSKKKKRWTYEEDQALRKGISEFGLGHWVKIKSAYEDVLKARTNVNIKDRYRTLASKDEV